MTGQNKGRQEARNGVFDAKEHSNEEKMSANRQKRERERLKGKKVLSFQQSNQNQNKGKEEISECLIKEKTSKDFAKKMFHLKKKFLAQKCKLWTKNCRFKLWVASTVCHLQQNIRNSFKDITKLLN